MRGPLINLREIYRITNEIVFETQMSNIRFTKEFHQLTNEFHRFTKEFHRITKEIYQITKEFHQNTKEIHQITNEIHQSTNDFNIPMMTSQKTTPA